MTMHILNKPLNIPCIFNGIANGIFFHNVLCNNAKTWSQANFTLYLESYLRPVMMQSFSTNIRIDRVNVEWWGTKDIEVWLGEENYPRQSY